MPRVHSLDGYTCQVTHSLMDEPQMKPCTSLGGSSWHLSTASTDSTPRHLDTSRHRQITVPPLTPLDTSRHLDTRHLDTSRQSSTPLDTSRHLSTPRQPGLTEEAHSFHIINAVRGSTTGIAITFESASIAAKFKTLFALRQGRLYCVKGVD